MVNYLLMGNKNSSGSQGGSPIQTITKRDLREPYWRNKNDCIVVVFVISMLLTFMVFHFSYRTVRKRWCKGKEVDELLDIEIGMMPKENLKETEKG
jgi:hypothetical protein